MTISVDIYEANALTPVATVDPANIVDGAVQDMVAGDSLGELTVGVESPNAAQFTEGRLLRWSDDDVPVFWSLIEANDKVAVAESKSRVPRQITVRGRGLIGQWDDARVGQWPGMEQANYYTRHFNYASPGKSDRIDGSSFDHGPVLDFDVYGQPNQPDRPPPTSWRAPTARRIGSAAFNLDEPDGVSLFRKSLTTADAVILRQHATADDRILGWVGGVPVLKGPDHPQVTWLETWPSATLLQPETTYDLVFATSNEYTAPGGSATWLGAAGWLLPNAGAGLTTDTLAYITSTAWNGLRPLLDPTPGWTPPEIVARLLTEFQAHFWLTGWEVVDEGTDWAEIQERTYETRKTTGGDVIRGFEADGLAEFAVTVSGPTKRLHMFKPGEMGNFHLGAPGPTPDGRELLSARYGWV